MPSCLVLCSAFERLVLRGDINFEIDPVQCCYPVLLKPLSIFIEFRLLSLEGLGVC